MNEAMRAGDVVLSLRAFGAAFGERVILSAVDLELRNRHVTVLMGPSGTGKSTLLRTIAGCNNASPSLRTWGNAQFLDGALGEGELPALVMQSSRLMMSSVLQNIVQELPERHQLTQVQQRDLARRLLEQAGLVEIIGRLDQPVVELPLALQRHLSIVRLAAAGPRLLCLDEPTSGLSEEDAQRLLTHIAAEATQRSILIVLHNREHAMRLGGTLALLAGGTIQEQQTTAGFFSDPRTRAAKDFVRTGSCSVTDPNADPATLDAEAPPPTPPPPETQNYVSDAFGPRGFLWLKKGRLAGTPRPGVFFELDYDLKALARVGVTRLFTLTETAPEVAAMAAHGIDNHWFPIRDMDAPNLAHASAICTAIDDCLRGGEVVAVHCRAGLGRTGTVLAAYLIWEGQPALAALDQVRRIEPRWVQSAPQVEFLERFFAFVSTRGGARPRAPSAFFNSNHVTTPGVTNA